MGIFDTEAGVFTVYRASIAFRDKLMGGTPRDPRLIEGWLRTKTGVSDEEEIRQMMLRTLVEIGADVRPDMGYDELVAASQKVAAIKQSVGFKRDPERGLYLESRTIKAMLKECTNVLYAGDRWGKTKKGPRSFLAERVFISPDRLWLDRTEPDGVELFVGHVSGPQGPQSNLTYYEYVADAALTFDVLVTHDAVDHDHWPEIWVLAQENGLGALRSQGFGRFDILAWEPASVGKLRSVA